MVIGAMYPSLTALQAFGFSAQNTAHNLANVQTEGFKAGHMNFADLPEMSGVYAQGPQISQAQGPLIPHQGLPPRPPQAGVPLGFVEGSTTDIPTEMVNLIVTSRGYQANTKPIIAADEMMGIVINLKV